MKYKMITTVDISATGQYRSEEGRELAKHQQQNFDTVLQTIGLRSNITYTKPPVSKYIKGHEINLDTDDIVRVWEFVWDTELDDLFLKDGDAVSLLKEDFNFVPYIPNLTENWTVNPSVFKTQRENINTFFYLIE